MRTNKKKKKMRKRDWYLVTAIINLTWFTIAVLYINYHGNEVSPELILGWFAAWTAELLAIAGLTRAKNKDESEA